VTTSEVYVVVEHIRGQVAEISYVLLAAGRQLVDKLGGSLVAVVLSSNSQELIKELGADRVLCCDHPSLVDFNPEIYRQILAGVIQAKQPRLVLFGDTSTGADLAGSLSVRLGCPLVSSCRKLTAQDGKVAFTSQICGGKIMVEGQVPEPVALVAMIPGEYKTEAGQVSVPPEVEWLPVPDVSGLRTSVKRYIEPEVSDVDISKEEILVSVGRGIQNQDNMALAQELADALGGVLVASRPIVDQGWLPTSRLVGKSGKKVNAKLYLALGISGAPEHVEALGDSQVVVAVNTDPEAPIFSIAKVGTTIDLLDLAPVLTEKIQLSKSS
jgi:electron transfer flavoprotein alpha subunit